MKRRFIIITLICLILFSASGLFAQWYYVTDFPDINGRLMPFCLSINNKMYMGSGISLTGPTAAKMDNYEYNPISNSWITKSIPPLLSRSGAFYFTIGNLGYVGSGSSDGGTTVFNDFWSYDPINDIWTQLANFPGLGRIEAVSVVINNKAYVIGGVKSNGNPLDCWEYDPQLNIWTQKTSPPANYSNLYAVGFTNGVSAYCGIGGGNDFWRYDPPTDAWTQLTGLPQPIRKWTVAGLNPNSGKGFVGLGGNSPAAFTDFYTYDISSDSWALLPTTYDLPVSLANSRSCLVAGDLYIGTGNIIAPPYGIEKRIFKLRKGNSINEDSNKDEENLINCYPNPVSDKDVSFNYSVKYDGSVQITLYNSSGVLMKELLNTFQSSGSHFLNIPIDGLAQGTYYIEFKAGDVVQHKNFVIVR